MSWQMPSGMPSRDTFEILKIKLTPLKELAKNLVLISDKSKIHGCKSFILDDFFGVLCSAIHYYDALNLTCRNMIWEAIDLLYRYFWVLSAPPY